ncbi:AroM family protein [Bacillus sp. Bva_UNVM-123]|uniref:AroM family protein n=1 Tax=Bacillus sp. Bva_UNVM-123 TaxID=2829798 RepID=UPI00391F0D37
MVKSIGIITLGQTPREDMIPAIEGLLPPDTRIIEKGVLDGKSSYELLQFVPEKGQTTLISRLRNGGSAIMAKEKILPIIQKLIDELNDEKVSLIIIACTGKFPLFKSGIPLVYPDHLLNYIVEGLFREGSIGVIVPLQSQVQTIMKKWNDGGFHSIVECCSPYDFNEEQLIRAVERLNEESIHTIVLDFMGYTESMKTIVKNHTTKPVILSRNMIYKVAMELI